MTAAFAVACLFAALLAEGNTLSCYHCASEPGKSCASNPTTCKSGTDSCLTAYTEVTRDGETLKIITRSCDESKACNQVSSVSLPKLNTREITTCCNSDNCVPKEIPALPPASTRKNNVMCPWCFEEKSSTCSSKQMQKCTGEENKCVQLSEKDMADTSSYAYTMQGCATTNFCIRQNNSETTRSPSVTTEIRCSNNSMRTEHGILLAVVAGLMLLKAII